MQVAGGGVGCVLEWRDRKARKHWRAYLENPTVPFEDGTTLGCGAGRIALRRNEWLRIGLVIEAFVAFLEGAPFPKAIKWRDISAFVGPVR